ncbi:DUF2950 domain-containing protein [Roseomonas terrae]|uniref:DUF2950 domain-containing protein n=1 Tax=Neoroseomonas terrae TaxID=424799 RepID=A0ABS5EIA6_9PROT|nr:DUF2950 domain-containing protein [Neoroseomonas terrae]
MPPASFRTPEQGFAALVAALRAPGNAQALRVLGTAGTRLIRSGDPVEDRMARQRFLAAYDEKAEILRPGPDRAELQVGDDGWPLPLVLVRLGDAWRFDTAAATQEIVDRRIGRNELDTIDTLRELARAQDDYARTAGRSGALRAYARRFFSTPGQHDGLYWESAPGEPDSPLGPLFAAASAGGYARSRGDTPQPFHGYLFRMLESQGAAAAGGATDYVVNGRMIGGFAAIAWPAQYGVSGIKTFMVSYHGEVWERDLGPETARAAARIASFDPGDGWTRVAE